MILEYVVSKAGKDRVQQALNISRYTMWRLLNRRVLVDDAKLRILLGFLTPREFEDVLSAEKMLEAIGVLRNDGTVDYSTVIEILKKASEDEYLKQLIIKFVVDNFHEDVKKAIGLFPTTVTLHWDEGFDDVV